MKKRPHRPAEEKFRDSLTQFLRARIPLLCVETYEEHRAVAAIVETVAALRVPRPVWVWTATRGLVDPQGRVEPNTGDPNDALGWIIRCAVPGAFVLLDLHTHLTADTRGQLLVRRPRDIAEAFQRGEAARACILVSPRANVPADLEQWTYPGTPDVVGPERAGCG